MPGLFINSGMLFSTAQTASSRAASNDVSPGSNDALIAIVFAAAAVEASINEIAELASQPTIHGAPNPQEISSCAALLSEVEDSRGTTTLKYMMARAALTGTTYDKGSQPYQDFALLLDLRNALLHLKFDRIHNVKVNEVDVQHPRVIDRLRSRGLLAPTDKNTIASWVYLINTPVVAKWACGACSAMVKSLVACIPNSELKKAADLFYSWSLQADKAS